MSMFDKSLAVIIAVGYNITAHIIASNVSKQVDSYDTRIQRTSIVLIVAGLIAIFASRQIKNDKDNKNNRKTLVLAQALWYGGVLLIFTPLLVVWTGVSNDMKLILLVVLLGLIVCYSKPIINKPDKKLLEVADLDELD